MLMSMDGLKFSQKALQRACEIAKALDSKIILLYVIENPPVISLLDRRKILIYCNSLEPGHLKKANDMW